VVNPFTVLTILAKTKQHSLYNVSEADYRCINTLKISESINFRIKNIH